MLLLILLATLNARIAVAANLNPQVKVSGDPCFVESGTAWLFSARRVGEVENKVGIRNLRSRLGHGIIRLAPDVVYSSEFGPPTKFCGRNLGWPGVSKSPFFEPLNFWKYNSVLPSKMARGDSMPIPDGNFDSSKARSEDARQREIEDRPPAVFNSPSNFRYVRDQIQEALQMTGTSN